VYPSNSIARLEQFVRVTGKNINCDLIFDDDKPTWSAWVHAWILHPPRPDFDWVAWEKAVPGRRIVISQPMVPDDAPADWRVLGARGDYNGYATHFAKELVAGGLGNSIIRLGWEANGDYNQENALGTDPAQYRDWAEYWGQLVRAMRAVRGAHFLFDWTISEYWRPIPLAAWYPGNDVVDIIGIDAYDGVFSGDEKYPNAQARWRALYNEPDGLATVIAFARANGKPMSIPEWGLVPTTTAGGGGDDPAYIEGLASVIDHDNVEYDSYFGSSVLTLFDAPLSLASYKRYFPAGVKLAR
jgi:hypothetical protein